MKTKDSILKTFINGSLMGIADAIPGVSGATIALILGIYEQLIHSISFFFSNLTHPAKLLKSKELRFLFNLYLGVFVMLYLFLKIIENLLKNNEIQLFSYFVGLIVASIIFLFKQNKKIVLKKVPMLIIGFLTGILVLSFNAVTENHSLAMNFISGTAAISAMILPGISGAYVLLMLNQYAFIAHAIVNLNIPVLSVFVLGILIGIFFMSKTLSWLLKRHHDSTMAFLIGLMTGGLKTPIQRVNGNIVSLIVFGALGAITVFLITVLQQKSAKEKS